MRGLVKISGLALLALSFFSQADGIFDNAVGGLPPQIVSTCMYDSTTSMESYLNTQSNINFNNLVAGNTSTSKVEGYYYEWYNETVSGSTSCYGQVAAYTRRYTYNETNGQWYFQNNISVGSGPSPGSLTSAPTCPPEGEGNIDYQFGGQVNGELQCFNEQSLKDADTCDVNASWLPSDGSGASQVCQNKEDGSQCRYSLQSVDGQSFYAPTAEPDSCYTGGIPDYSGSAETAPAPYPSDCTTMSDGVTVMCPEDPSNVCDSNGTCQTGCGTVAFDGVEEFVCFSGDTDGDGIGDYADPDIDGDGIPNDQDTDADGNGQDDPDYSNTPGSTTSTGTVTVDMTSTNNLIAQGTAATNNVKTAVDGVKGAVDGVADILSDTTYTGGTGSDLDAATETSLDETEQSLMDEFNKTAEEAGFITLVPDDVEFIDTFIGSLPLAECQNPVFLEYQIDLCSKATLINNWLYWIVASLTLIAVWKEIHHTVRREK